LILHLFTSPAEGDASVTSVIEYLLTQPILSFNVSSSTPLPVDGDQERFSEGESDADDNEGGNIMKSAIDFDSRRNVVMLKLHCVHTRYHCD
jgi:enhancer of mRNA-decapping protein 4